MSYTIERGKRVLSLRVMDDRFDSGETLLFVRAASDNNVSPRSYDWNVLAIDSFSNWGGEIQLPRTIWDLGAAADGGSIKPWDKYVSGLGYVKSWKEAVKSRKAVDGWTPQVSIWAGLYGEEANEKAKKVNDGGPELFGEYEHLRNPLHAAFRRLFPRPLRGGQQSAYVATRAELLDAIYLFMHRRKLPVALYLTDREGCSFLAGK